MKTIGLLGGMSLESTIAYYRLINETVNQRLGDLRTELHAKAAAEFALAR